MATNDELNKGKKLLSDQAQLAGVLDNAFKSIAANISVAFEDVMDTLEGVDRVNQKIAKSYERDILGAIKKISISLTKPVFPLFVSSEKLVVSHVIILL